MGKPSKHGIKQVGRLLSNEGIEVEIFLGLSGAVYGRCVR